VVPGGGAGRAGAGLIETIQYRFYGAIMANGSDEKTTQFSTSFSNLYADLLDWLCDEQESKTNRSQMLAICFEEFLHNYILSKRPDLAKQTCIVKKQAFFKELYKAISEDAKG